MRNKVEDQLKQEGNQPPPPPPSATSPSSTSSSPTHEFSFTISLHNQTSTTVLHGKSKPSPSIAIDLSPADEIFFHGHLLPLHLLSHLPLSPRRSSTNSLDSFTLPITEQQNLNKTSERKEKPKFSFSLFGLSKRRKGSEIREKLEEKEKKKKKMRFDLSHVLKRYMRMIRPLLLSFRWRREKLQKLSRHSYSFSGNWGSREKLRQNRRELSAPATMKTSPENSGVLVATGIGNAATSTKDSTMEELQAAIQAAIAHCKDSIAMEDKLKN